MLKEKRKKAFQLVKKKGVIIVKHTYRRGHKHFELTFRVKLNGRKAIITGNYKEIVNGRPVFTWRMPKAVLMGLEVPKVIKAIRSGAREAYSVVRSLWEARAVAY